MVSFYKKYAYRSVEELNWNLQQVCKSGDLDAVRYLLTSDKLPKKAEMEDDPGFTWACYYGHLPIVKYLLTSPELKKHVDIHLEDDYPFAACLKQKQLEILKYFIFDMNIRRTPNIDLHLALHLTPQVEKWFEMRDLNKNLIQDIKIKNKTDTKKHKL